MGTMDTQSLFLNHMKRYKEIVEPGITELMQRWEHETERHFGAFSHQTVQTYNAILARGGKRLRGSLTLASYEMCGGADVQSVRQVAVALEMLHTYLLIVDDIYDYSTIRRGGPTAHIMVRDLHAQKKWQGDSLHFGEAVADVAALFGSHAAMEEVTRAPLDPQIKVTILRLVNRAIVNTCFGQVNDIFNEATREAGETQVQNTLTWKTAYYSFINPLQVGAVAAGVRESETDCLITYGKHLGLAFQVADDILGTFGDETTSGKSVKDDLREGKMTLLVARALAKADPTQRKTLLNNLGNHKLTDADYERCKNIMQQTGALQYARELAVEQSQLAVAALERAPHNWRTDQLNFLRELARYVVNRRG